MIDRNKLEAPFPKEAILTRKGAGNRNFSYVQGHTIIHRLNEACGDAGWSFTVLRIDRENDTFTAHVELTIPGLGSRQHIGVQTINPNGGEDLIKGVVTDALKKAATLFGVGLELYGPDYEGDSYSAASAAQEPRGQRAPNGAATRPAADENEQARRAYFAAFTEHFGKLNDATRYCIEAVILKRDEPLVPDDKRGWEWNHWRAMLDRVKAHVDTGCEHPKGPCELMRAGKAMLSKTAAKAQATEDVFDVPDAGAVPATMRGA